MKHLIALFFVVMLTGCFGTTKTITIVEKEYIAVTVADDSFALPKVPDPVKMEELVPLTPRERLSNIFNHSNLLYIHIDKLERQILSVQSTMKEKAERVLKDNKK